MSRTNDPESDQRMFNCDKCNESFSFENSLEIHKRIHATEKPFTCNICNESFIEEYALSYHKSLHMIKKGKRFTNGKYVKRDLSESPFVCDVCEKRCSTKYTLRNHLLIHSSDRPYHCQKCPKKFQTKAFLDIHMLLHPAGADFLCSMCNKKFTCRSSLYKHLQQKCWSMGQGNSYLFDEELSKYPHTKNPDNTYKCEICFKTFPRANVFERHAMVHSGEKSHQCGICFLGFTSQKSLTYHRETHSKVKSYMCDKCPEKFKTYKTLAHHRLSHRYNITKTKTSKVPPSSRDTFKADVRNFEDSSKCKKCDYEFKNKKDLKSHMSWHYKSKPLQCDNCSETVNGMKAFMRHCETHNPDLNIVNTHFECDKCFDVFGSEEVFTKHLQMHSIVKTYKCDICSKEIAGTQAFNKHALTHKSNLPIGILNGVSVDPQVVMDNQTSSQGSFDELYMCAVCSEEFTDNLALERHSITHESEALSDDSDWEYETAMSESASDSESEDESINLTPPQLNFFLNSNNGPLSVKPRLHTYARMKFPIESLHKCDLCLIEFKSKMALARHLRNHSSENSYTCSICSQKFTDLIKFRKHSLSHKTLFSCDRCSETFDHEGALLNHYNIHLHTNPFVCHICRKSYATQLQLDKHSYLHKYEAAESCEV